jgi:hypothetical protein
MEALNEKKAARTAPSGMTPSRANDTAHRVRERVALSSAHPVSNVVNLNKFRKRKAKADEKKRAEANVRAHGRTTAERTLESKQKELLDRRVDGAKLIEPTDDEDDADEP